MVRSVGQQLATRRKQADALQLRQEGYTYDEIARKVGYAGASGAQKAVKRALAEVGTEEAKELLRLQLLRLDEMLAKVWPVVNDPTHRRHLAATNTALRIMHKMDVLVGLDS
jgi:hypothetical protein